MAPGPVSEAGKIAGFEIIFNADGRFQADQGRIIVSGGDVWPSFTPTFNHFRDLAGLG